MNLPLRFTIDFLSIWADNLPTCLVWDHFKRVNIFMATWSSMWSMWWRRVAAPVGLFSMKSSLLWLLLKRENCLFSYQIAHSQRNHAYAHTLSRIAVCIAWWCLSKLWSCECCASLACLREPTQDSAQTPTHWHLHPSWHKHTCAYTNRTAPCKPHLYKSDPYK